MANVQKKTLIVITVDESGSMESYKAKTMSAYREFVQGQTNNKDTKAFLSLIKFNYSAKLFHGVLPIKDVAQLDEGNYHPCGGTALYDAVNMAIDSADAQADLFDQIIIVIMTDGEENCSRIANLQMIRQKITVREASEKWTFVYIGENSEKWARDTGMPVGNTMTYQPGREKEQMQALHGGINNARNALSTGDVEAQRLAKKSFFKAYLEREGPRNLGTVQWPKAKADALTGQKFFLTGVLETITYDDCIQLIKDCGGTIMTVVSPKLTYLIVGREAGPKKLETAVAKGVAQINEEAFFKYVTDKINGVGSSPFGTPTIIQPSSGSVDSTILKNPPPNWTQHQKDLAAAAVAKAVPTQVNKRPADTATTNRENAKVQKRNSKHRTIVIDDETSDDETPPATPKVTKKVVKKSTAKKPTPKKTSGKKVTTTKASTKKSPAKNSTGKKTTSKKPLPNKNSAKNQSSMKTRSKRKA